jgi:acyl-coenzyme A thioesterase PaaI-like protein
MVVLPKVSINTDMHKGLCFACGQNNPIGLKLTFTKDGNTLKTEFTPGEFHQGWPGVVHGGILTCLLDEAMNYAAYFEGITCITASMQIRLKQPVEVEKPLVISASVTKNRRKIIETKARACLKDGTVVAEGSSKQFVIDAEPDGGVNSEELRSNA